MTTPSFIIVTYYSKYHLLCQYFFETQRTIAPGFLRYSNDMQLFPNADDMQLFPNAVDNIVRRIYDMEQNIASF
ncbi:hypothetical protein QA584_20465 [Anaerocolumna sp. AGMB13025]|uniref:hypothetical protein n=1 Tax=Anaerocolumna sp. AGMB13025 TaxID=3039116 RepID=UPI00241EB425|nr:hypothetical protein [Anaerocolumna sp. AGMB13025]WFR55969.1 hypothetical protein QA584_20465 [Anaerocolumna sp. AGMB13025]